MSDQSRDIGLIVADAFQIIRRNPDTVEQIERQTENTLSRAELLAKLAIEQLYDANIIRVNVKALREELTEQTSRLATFATETKPTNRAEFLAMLIIDADENTRKRMIAYLPQEVRTDLWALLTN